MGFRDKHQDQIYETIIDAYSRNLHEKLYQALLEADYTIINVASQVLSKKYQKKPVDLESWWEKYDKEWYSPSSRSHLKAKQFFKKRRELTNQQIKRAKNEEKKTRPYNKTS